MPFVQTETKAGMKVSNLYISQVKRKCGIEVGKNLRVATRRMDCLQGNSTTAATDLEFGDWINLVFVVKTFILGHCYGK